MVVERIRYSDKVPVSLEISRFPETFAFLLQEDLNNCSMFELLKTKYNIDFENSEDNRIDLCLSPIGDLFTGAFQSPADFNFKHLSRLVRNTIPPLFPVYRWR